MPDSPIPIRRETRAARRRRMISEFAGHILALRNIDAAAKATGITVRTARHWLASDAFGEAYVELHKPTLAANAALARASTPAALQACASIVSDPTAPATARVAAARVIVDSNVALNEEPDLVRQLQDRIRQLEERLEAHR